MSKTKWIKSGPHKGKRSPYGGPAKTARGSVLDCPYNFVMKSGRGVASTAPRLWGEWGELAEFYGDRPPRGMQGGE